MNKLSRTIGRKTLKSFVQENSKKACGCHCFKINDFGVKIGESVIIDKVNLHIHCGELTAVIGKNGAGKSTLIKAILNEIPHTGNVEFKYIVDEERCNCDNNNCTHNSHFDVKLEASRGDNVEESMTDLRIGYIPQHLNISKNTPTSVYDLFASYISKKPVFLWRDKKSYQIIKEQLARFEADMLIDKMVGDLSGGELQRVLLSLATYPTPNLLLLDEPVSGVDQNGMELFYHAIEKLKNNYDLAIILISHDLEYVQKYADHVILLDQTIKIEGTSEEVFLSKEFRDAFGNLRFSEV